MCFSILLIFFFLLLHGKLVSTQHQINAPAASIPNEIENNLFNFYTFRLKPGEDLKRGIAHFVSRHNLRAASVVTCVGSLRQVNIRLASHRNGSMTYLFRDREMFEIVSLVGTFESYEDDKPAYGHLHISLSDTNGHVIGGHLMKGCIVFTTAEITLVENTRVQFKRVWDKSTGFNELEIEQRQMTSAIVPQKPNEVVTATEEKKPHWSNKFRVGFKSVLDVLDISDSIDQLDYVVD